MLQNIRDNSQGWIAKTIIGLIVVLMALTGVDAIVTGTSNNQSAAQVNGESISLNQLSQAVEMQRRQLLQQLGQGFDASALDEKLLREASLKGLIERALLLQGATDAKFAFSQQALDQVIVQTPDFLVDGRFSAERFDQVLRQLGYSRLQFRQMLEQEMLIGQLRAGLSGSSFATDEEAAAFARLEKQTRDFSQYRIKADAAKVQLSDDDVKAFYEANKSQFTSPEQVVLEYVELKKEAFFSEIKVSEDDLSAAYNAQVDSLEEQRQAAHILIEVAAGASDEQAKNQIETIQKRLQQGEDFAALAKQFSQDTGSAKEGGNLGYAGKGVYDPAFEQALYALRQGEVSAPVRTAFGWHLIKLLGVQTPQVPSFSSVREKLEHDLKSQRADQRFIEVSKQLEDAAFESSDLTQPAQELGLSVQTSEAFGRQGDRQGIGSNRQVVQAAFSQEVLDDGSNSSAIELDPNTLVVVRVKEHRKPEQLMLEQVGDSIRRQLAQSRAADAAKAAGEALIVALRDGKPEGGVTWTHFEASGRNQDGVDPRVLQALFRMPRPEGDQPQFAGLSLNGGDFVVLRLNGVSEPVSLTAEQDKVQYRRFLSSRTGQQDFAAFRKLLETKADIERY
jgi:peptidyl-prolyl cis-trans isomerase D